MSLLFAFSHISPVASIISHEIRNYLSPDISVRRGDVMSAWSGLRPLVRDPNKADTKSLARNHIIEVGPKSRLITIAGGKCECCSVSCL